MDKYNNLIRDLNNLLNVFEGLHNAFAEEANKEKDKSYQYRLEGISETFEKCAKRLEKVIKEA